MNLSPDQLRRFWREWTPIVAKNKWTKPEAELQRRSLLARAGFQSLKDVDRTTGYTRLLHELAALRDDLAGMINHTDQANHIRVLHHNIRQLAAQITGRPEHQADGYWIAIARDKFNGQTKLYEMTLPQLTQLRDTLARALSHRRRSQKVGTTSTSSVTSVPENCPF